MKTLACHVTVHHPETGESFTFEPGDTLPDWAVDVVTNPDVFEVVGGVEDSSETSTPPTSAPSLDDPGASVPDDPAGDDDYAEAAEAVAMTNDPDPLLVLSKADLTVMADSWDCTGLTDRDTKATIASAIREAGYDGDGSEMVG